VQVAVWPEFLNHFFNDAPFRILLQEVVKVVFGAALPLFKLA
jgi:hypothetical protein